MTPWTIDATSGKAVPANATEWTAFISGAGLSLSAPSNLWLCQESSGNLADSIGATSFPQIGSGHLYAQTISGWTRKGAGLTGTSGQRFEISSYENSATTSVMLFALVQNLSTPATSRGIAGIGNNTVQFGAVLLTSTSTVRARSTNLVDGSANAFGTSAIRPVVMIIDVTGTRTRYYSDTEKLSPTWAACTGSRLALGSIDGGAPIEGRYLYAAAWTGGAAEVSDANVKAMLVAMGWSIPWS